MISKEQIKKAIHQVLDADVVYWHVHLSSVDVEIAKVCKCRVGALGDWAAIAKEMHDAKEISGDWPEIWSSKYDDDIPDDREPWDETGSTSSRASDTENRALKNQVSMLNDQVKTLTNRLTEAMNRPEKVVEKEKIVGIQLLQGKKVVKKVTGIFHKQMPKLLQLIEDRDNIMIFGEAGCGKTYIVGQAAEALKMKMSSISCTTGMSETQLLGRVMPKLNGKDVYIRSQFIERFEEGGIFFFDELDAADPNVLLVVNSALANGYVTVPSRSEKPMALRHPDFVCIASSNTAGTNADRLYSGRSKLDAATLDRFAIGKLHFTYDTEMEKLLCPDENLLKKLWGIRKGIEDNRLERVMSTRFILSAYKKCSERNWTWQDLCEVYFAGWREDERTKCLRSVPV